MLDLVCCMNDIPQDISSTSSQGSGIQEAGLLPSLVDLTLKSEVGARTAELAVSERGQPPRPVPGHVGSADTGRAATDPRSVSSLPPSPRFGGPAQRVCTWADESELQLEPAPFVGATGVSSGLGHGYRSSDIGHVTDCRNNGNH